YGNDSVSALSDAFSTYKNVAEDFPSEKDSNNPNFIFGQQSLINAIELARDENQDATRANLIKIFIEKYPSASEASKYTEELNRIAKFDYSHSAVAIQVDNSVKSFSLIEISAPSAKSSAQFSYGERHQEIRSGQTINLSDWSAPSANGANYVRLVDVSSDRVRIDTNCGDYLNTRGRVETYSGYLSNDIGGFSGSGVLTLDQGAVVCGKLLVLKSTDSKKVARIALIPSARNTGTDANLTVNIGIEKRAIKLNPEKTAEAIKNINESISTWENINNNIGKMVTGLKSACFATASVLTVKNFFGGLSGTALARQQVMPYWNDYCKAHVGTSRTGEENYVSMDACFLAKSSEISKDVSLRKNILDNSNTLLKEIEAKHISDSGNSIDSTASAKDLATKIKEKYGNEQIVNKEGKSVKVSEVLDETAIEKGWISYSELRDLNSNLEAGKTSGFSGIVGSGVGKSISASIDKIQTNVNSYQEYQNGQKAIGKGLPSPTIIAGIKGATLANVATLNSVSAQGISLSQDLGDVGNSYSYLSQDKNCEYITTLQLDSVLYSGRSENVNGLIPGAQYFLCLKKVADNSFSIEKAYVASSASDGSVSLKSQADLNQVRNTFGTIQSIKDVNLINPIKNPEVRYYETAPYKGMPAIVPFDIAGGWYAGTKQTLPIGGGIGAFDSSGKVTSFSLCNVGSNGIVDFDSGSLGDDICREYALNTGQAVSFPGLSDSRARDLRDKGVLAIQEATKQYGSGGNVVTINGKSLPTGKPMSNQPETKCQDFMSPRECNLMFNVCDPVICPPSRCNFGGEFPVQDVVQSGIIGSTLLCLPNIREGIYMPVCLSGIHAGIESYVSILKAHRDCLSENLKSGQMIGICDQIYSVYSCEFFWNQFAPLMKALIPKAIGMLMGQGTSRGGGEYMTVASAWSNTEKSINYMTQIYGVNAFKAFQLRNVENAGGEFCKAFVSTSVPTSLKSITQPDSPYQFSAYFDSIRFTDTTVPATSQYKVFYHIFAGNDAGVSYRVYLKNPPASSYYTANPLILVSTGFIGKGQTVDQTRDFTAPEGYQELCVNINGEEKCGFKQVSTSFAVNYIKDKVVSESITSNNIQSESECISGSTSLSALLNPNIQSVAQEAVNPAIYRRGVSRVCATDNPGKSTDPMRWVNVGNCGSNSMVCWLDKNSVDNAITDNNIGVKNATLNTLTNMQVQNLIDNNEILGSNESAAALDEAQGLLYDLLNRSNSKAITSPEKVASARNIISRLQGLLGVGGKESLLFWNRDKAQALYIMGQVYDAIARGVVMNDKNSKVNYVVASSSDSSGIYLGLNGSLNEIQTVSLNDLSISGQYNPATRQNLIKNRTNTGIYIQNNRLYLEKNFLGVNGLAKDVQLGAIDGNGNVKLLNNSKSYITDTQLYNALNGAKFGSYDIGSKSTPLVGKTSFS
ncbi:MAG: hypothetical protein AABX66_02630, partial [Nanoarchaeota archaeon]